MCASSASPHSLVFSVSTRPGNSKPSLSIPTAANADDLSALVASDAPARSKSARQAAFNAAARVENPGLHNATDIECASCHLSETAQSLIGVKQFKSSGPNAADLFRPAAGINVSETAPPVIANPINLNIHMFNYLASRPTISRASSTRRRLRSIT